MSQLTERLQRELDLSTDPARRAELAARIAGHLARLGRFDAARKVIAEIRQQFGHGQSGRVTVWVMLAEGLIHHYEDLSPSAMERVRGAQALGVAMQYPTMIALASAWKAHIEFERSEFPAMFQSLASAVEHVADTDHDAQARLSIVLANSFMICGDRSQGQYWFKRGHFHAVANGDQASVDALLYNRAAFSLACLRVTNCRGRLAVEDLTAARTDIVSAKSLQHLMGISALDSHIRLLEARLLILEGSYESAVSALSAVRTKAPFASHNFTQSLIDLEVSFCRVMQGGPGAEVTECEQVDEGCFNGLDIDEQLVAAWMLRQMATVDRRFGDPVGRDARLEVLWGKYSDERAALAAGIAPFARA